MEIRLENIVKRFGKTAAVDDVSLAVGEGELFFIVGPSGCGKTTLLRLIAGFYECDGGRILFNGRPVDRLPPHRRNTGMVFQNYALWPHLTVAGNVAFGLTVPGRRAPAPERRRRVAEALRMVHMEEYSGTRPHQLSGGQQQRVALARALVIRPSCLLLDEPLSNLDARLRLEMRSEIRRIVRETGITSIYVTHDQKEALSMADRCAVMNRGRLEQVGSPDELYNSPSGSFVAGFIGEANILPARVIAAGGDSAVAESACGRWRGRPGGELEQGGRALVVIRPEALSIGDPAPAAENVIPGRVTESAYLGETREYIVETAQGPPLKVIEMSGRNHPRDGKNPVSLSADPQRVIIFPAGDRRATDDGEEAKAGPENGDWQKDRSQKSGDRRRQKRPLSRATTAGRTRLVENTSRIASRKTPAMTTEVEIFR